MDAEQSRLANELMQIFDRFPDNAKIPLPETCFIIVYARRLAELIKKGES